MRFEVPETDTVYVSGLPRDTTESSLAEYFGSIGVIKMDKKTRKHKIWLYRDKDTGGLKGDGTVSYEDPFSASSAIEWFHGKDWKGEALVHAHDALPLRPPATPELAPASD
jgi:RNA-binding protein FUS